MVAKTDIFRDVRCGLELGFWGGGKREPKQRHFILQDINLTGSVGWRNMGNIRFWDSNSVAEEITLEHDVVILNLPSSLNLNSPSKATPLGQATQGFGLEVAVAEVLVSCTGASVAVTVPLSISGVPPDGQHKGSKTS
jgi:hypothetical protein